MAFQSTRRHTYESYSVASTASSGTVGQTGSCAHHDDAIAFVNVTTLTAGTLALQIEISGDDGTTWYAHPDATAALAAFGTTGAKILVARVPIGSKMRLAYTVVTGPVAFTLNWEFGKRGDIR